MQYFSQGNGVLELERKINIRVRKQMENPERVLPAGNR